MTACFDVAQPIYGGDKKLLLVSAAAMVDSDNCILLSRRRADKEFANLWEFPGGKCEAGEVPEQALLRELREELGIETVESCLAPIGFSSYDYGDFHACVLLFVCRQWRGVAVGKEGQDVRWVSLLDLMDYEQLPANGHLCALLRDLL